MKRMNIVLPLFLILPLTLASCGAEKNQTSQPLQSQVPKSAVDQSISSDPLVAQLTENIADIQYYLKKSDPTINCNELKSIEYYSVSSGLSHYLIGYSTCQTNKYSKKIETVPGVRVYQTENDSARILIEASTAALPMPKRAKCVGGFESEQIRYAAYLWLTTGSKFLCQTQQNTISKVPYNSSYYWVANISCKTDSTPTSVRGLSSRMEKFGFPGDWKFSINQTTIEEGSSTVACDPKIFQTNS